MISLAFVFQNKQKTRTLFLHYSSLACKGHQEKGLINGLKRGEHRKETDSSSFGNSDLHVAVIVSERPLLDLVLNCDEPPSFQIVQQQPRNQHRAGRHNCCYPQQQRHGLHHRIHHGTTCHLIVIRAGKVNAASGQNIASHNRGERLKRL